MLYHKNTTPATATATAPPRTGRHPRSCAPTHYQYHVTFLHCVCVCARARVTGGGEGVAVDYPRGPGPHLLHQRRPRTAAHLQ